MLSSRLETEGLTLRLRLERAVTLGLTSLPPRGGGTYEGGVRAEPPGMVT